MKKFLFPIVATIVLVGGYFMLHSNLPSALAVGPFFATSTPAGGNWSATSTWAGGVVPGDNYFVDIVGPVIINQNIGSAGNGIDRITLNNPSASLTINTSSPRTILFNSTGIDPLGSGTVANPGNDATMFGIFLNGAADNSYAGTLSFVGTASNPITLSSANGTSPIYISNPGDSHFSDAHITLKYVDMYNMGTAGVYPYDFTGINVNGSFNANSASVDIENCRFNSPYIALSIFTQPGASNLPLTFSNNYITGNQAPEAINYFVGYDGATSTITGNTEILPSAAGYFINGSGTVNGLVIQENAIEGTSTSTLGVFFHPALTGTNIIKENLNYNNSTTTYSTSIWINTQNSTSTIIDSNISEGSMRIMDASTIASAPIQETNNIGIANSFAAPGQGTFFFPLGQDIVSNNLAIWTSTSTDPENGFFDYVGSATTTVTYSHNTVIAATGGAFTTSRGIQDGEGTGAVYNDIDKNNLVFGDLNITGLFDGAPSSTFASDFNGVGVHHNDVYGTSSPIAAYCSYQNSDCTGIFGVGWQNGATAHPDSSYGDLTNVNPNFADPTRKSITNYDSRVIGGPGTIADVFTQLGYRSGWGGTYSLSATPIKDINTWIFAGYAPTNALLATAASDGTTIGAVSYQAPTNTTFHAVGIQNGKLIYY